MESNQRDQSLWDLGATNSLVAFSTERGGWATHSLLRFRRTFFDYQSPFSTLEFGWESNPLFIQKKPFQTFTFQTKVQKRPRYREKDLNLQGLLPFPKELFRPSLSLSSRFVGLGPTLTRYMGSCCLYTKTFLSVDKWRVYRFTTSTFLLN